VLEAAGGLAETGQNADKLAKDFAMRLSVKNQVLLVIDDDPMVGKVLGRILEQSTVIQITSLEQARLQLSKCRPYCIFLDVFLGDRENGLSLLPELKKRWPFVPVLVVTGDPGHQLISDALSAGADDFVRKPLMKEEVLARVQIRAEQCRLSLDRDSIRVGDVTFYSSKGVIRVGVNEEQLSPINQKLLRTLVASNGTMVTKMKLKMAAWDRRGVSDNALDRKLFELRTLLKHLGSRVEIVSLYGAGVHLKWKELSHEEL
jgi:DNA-binding response OmpR family regulator